MAVQDLKYKDLTEKIIGCAMKVHRYFESGFPESSLQKGTDNRITKNRYFLFGKEVERDIIYEDKVIHKRRLDLLVEDVVLVELKAIKEVDNAVINLVLNYLRVFKIEVGLLLNFGVPSLFFKRYNHTINS